MSDYDESYFLRNYTFVKQKDLLNSPEGSHIDYFNC